MKNCLEYNVLKVEMKFDWNTSVPEEVKEVKYFFFPPAFCFVYLLGTKDIRKYKFLTPNIVTYNYDYIQVNEILICIRTFVRANYTNFCRKALSVIFTFLKPCPNYKLWGGMSVKEY